MLKPVHGAIGIPSLPIRPNYVRAALALIVEGAKALSARNVVSDDLNENEITYYLSNEMKKVQQRLGSDIPIWNFRVHHQSTEDPLAICEIDFKFQWFTYASDFDRYLAAEAKKLRGRGKSWADKYVDEGVLDFVSGKYGRGHDFAIMMGYVVVGPLDRAISRVKEIMGKRRQKTAESSAFAPSGALTQHPGTHHSAHVQTGAMQAMTLVHLFLDFSGQPRNAPIAGFCDTSTE